MENTNIKIERAKLDLTQEELSNKIGVSRQAIHLIEKNKVDPKLSTVFKLARFFKLPIHILFKENIDKE